MTSNSSIQLKIKEVKMTDFDSNTNSQAVLHQEEISFTKNDRSLLEKILLLLLVVLLVALISVVAALIVEKNKGHSTIPVTKSPENTEEVCLTKDCVLAAAAIDRAIDYSVDPCENFYNFACGRWKKEHVIPEDQSSLSIFGILRDQTEIILKSLLEEPVKPNEIPSIEKAKMLYSSCTNYSLINKRGDTPLKELLLQEFGGWPLIYEEWDESNFDLVYLIHKLKLHGTHAMMPFYAAVDQKNSSKRILKIDQTSFGMPGQKYYQVNRNDKMLMSYENLIFSTSNLMGLANESKARDEVKAIVDFEIQLANISVPDERRRDNNALYNAMSLKEIHGNYSRHFNWSRYVLELMASPEVGVTDITDGEIIINQSPMYYQKLNDLLSITPNRTVANYLIWRLVMTVLKFGALGENYQNLMNNYNKVLFGTSLERPRFRTCSSYTTNVLSLVVGRMFVKDHFDMDSKAIALNMVKDLQSSFNELLSDLDWMDDETKKVAKEKNSFISSKIGYPEELNNDTYLEEFYSNLTFNKEKFFENIFINERESFYENLRQLRLPIDKEKWNIPPPTVNAYYSSLMNQIFFPAGILQPPFFSKTFPKSLNFGGIGVVIGHEITHGFDDRGRQYDKFGNLIQWWTSNAVEKFKAKAQCIVEQYGNYTINAININLNGVNTQGENIADNGGLKQAYKAYRQWVNSQGKEEKKLPGLNFSNNELFFINFSQLWCILMTEGDAISKVRTGVHSPGEFRVIGSLQNSMEFSEAFKCPIGSYMNPSHKCKVW